MRGARFLLPLLVALAVSACARQQQTYVMDPNTGQPVPVMSQQQFDQQQQQQYAQAPYVQQAAPARGLYSSSPAYAQQSYAQQPPSQAYAQQTYAQPQTSSGGRGLLTSRGNSAPVYVQQPQVYAQQPQVYAQQPYAGQYVAPRYAAPRGGPYAAAPNYGYASANPNDQPAYTLDSGDKLRVVVFGQDGITNSYMVDAGGNISLPLVGIVPARGSSTAQLGRMIAERLKQG